MQLFIWYYIGKHTSMLNFLKNGVPGTMSTIWAKTKMRIGVLCALLWTTSWEQGKNGSTKANYNTMHIQKGDLVACYVSNSEEWETLIYWGIVIEINDTVQDVLVLDSHGYQRWWPARRWKVLSSKKNIKYLDLDIKLA